MMLRPKARFLLSIALALPGGAAEAETLASATVALQGGYSSEPYLGVNLPGGVSSGAGNATASIAPTFTWRSPTSTLTVNGAVDHTVYSRVYQDVTNWQVGSSFEQKFGSRSALTLETSASSRRNISFTLLDPSQPDISGVEDVGYRVQTYRGSAAFTSQLSALDTLSVSVNGSLLRYPGNVATISDADVFGGSISYGRALSGTTSVSGGVSYSHNTYEGNRFGASDIISPYAGVAIQIDERLNVEASLGVDFSSIDTLTGKSRNTSFYGKVDVCRRGPRSALCGAASRSVQANSYGGTSTTTSVSGTYNYRLTSLSQFSIAATYTDVESLQGVLFGNTGYSNVSARANYERRLTERLSGVVTAAYQERIRSFSQTGNNIMGSLGVSYRLGR